MTEYDSEDIAGQRLSALLGDVDPPGPDMEVEGLLVAGRRATRRHRTLLAGSAAGGVAALLVAAVLIVGGPRAADGKPAPVARPSTTAGPTTGKPTNPPATSPCTIQTLSAPVPIGQVFDMDPTGRYVVAGADDNRVIVWTDGVPAVYRAPDSGSIIDAVVNRHGVVAVGIQDGYPHTVTRSWIKVGSKFTRLTPAKGWDDGSPRGIDSAGDVVTWAFNDSATQEAGVFYAAGHPNAPQVLPAPAAGAAAYGIGDNGIIAGNVGDGEYAFYWDSHHHGHRAPTPSGFRHGKGNATAGDWMVGYVASDNGQPVAARWNLSTGKVDVFDGRDQASDVDTAGDFVGDPYDVSPYLYRAGKFVDLPVPDSSQFSGALGLTEDGRTVLGYAQPDLGGATALLWHC